MDWKVLVGSKVLLLILLSTSVKSDDDEKRVVCYYTNWSVYRPGTAKFSPQNINPYLCTHLIYAFGGFTKDNTLKPFDKYQDIDKGGYAKFTGLKTYNKDLKTLLAIGGWNEGSSRFSPMVADPQRRRQFVKNAVKFLRQNHFDGLDLDWEYPAFRDGGKPRDKDNYASLVQELREEFEKESSKTGRPRLLLTMAVPAGTEYIDKGYDMPKLNEYLDFINLLSYDYHSAYEPAVNHHSPLYPLEEDNEYNYDNELTIDYTIKHLIKSGTTPEKIVIGIPTYGRSYTLFNEDANALGSPADGPGIEGDATREKGYLAYYEICESITKDDWTVEKPNPNAMGPYAFKKNQWVGYDDEDIVRKKAKYVNEKKLGGIMFWSIDNDDFRGKCHGRPYPLIEAAKEALFEDNGKQKEDEKSNSVSSRRRNSVSESSKSSSQSSNRKSSGSSTRRNTLSRSSSGKQSSNVSKLRNRSTSKLRNEPKIEEDPIDESAENSEHVEKTKPPSKTTRTRTSSTKSRFRTRLNISDRNSRKQQTTEAPQKHSKNKVTTPEPPTTPDPGGDFKCEDEGFFPHPRDCKKYFWCLDSGPSGLGIVANQFTCPSGLVFNKLADSCDYPRNVVCPKNKPQTTTTTTTTERTTTEKEASVEEDEDEDVDEEEYVEEEEEIEEKKHEEKQRKTTTTAKPLLYKTINRSRPTTSTTTTTVTPTTSRTTEDILDEEQDPKVIKELIDLIKKAGGIEHLEKQLILQEKISAGGSNQENGQVTPATISKSLYDRVLNRQAGKNNLFGLSSTRLSSNRKTDEVNDDEEEEEETIVSDKSNTKLKFVNGPGRSQFEGLDEVPEVKSLRRTNKPKYVTIERHSSSTTSSKIDNESNEDIIEEDQESEDNEDVASSEEKLISNAPERKNLFIQRSTPGYVNIRRSRPTTTTESSKNDNDDIKEADATTKDQVTHTVRRPLVRPTDVTQKEIKEETTTPKTRYISANRFRSTTVSPQKQIEQSTTESTTSKPETTTQSYSETVLPQEKTITVAGESGRISITPFVTDTPSTARIYTNDFSSTLKSTSPYLEDKTISTHYSTKPFFETTAAPNPNIIEDSVTESLLTVIPTESTTRETIPAVSQPRPFGYHRRSRPTTVASSASDATRGSLTGIETTSRPKVLDELIHHYPAYKDFSDHKTSNVFVTEHPKKTSIINNNLYSKTINAPENISITKVFPLQNPSKEYDNSERIVKVPVRFVDGPKDELFFLQIPERNLNASGINSIIKIEVLNSNGYDKENVNIIKNIDDSNLPNSFLVPEMLQTSNETNNVQLSLDTNTLKPNVNLYNSASTKIDTIKDSYHTTLLSRSNESDTPYSKITLANTSSVDVTPNNVVLTNLSDYYNENELSRTTKDIGVKTNESAIYNIQNLLVNDDLQLNNVNPTIKSTRLFSNSRHPNEKRKVHRQRVLIYRGASNNQPTNSSSQRKWIMKKVVRRRIRRVVAKPADATNSNTAVPVADVIDAHSTEVNTSRNPGLALFRRPGDPPLPRGVYTAITSATLSPTRKFYPVQIGIENTRVVGIMADQSGNPQNLELILADPPASISSTTDSGRGAVNRAEFRRKISTTISPRPIDQISPSVGPKRIISSEKRRQGQKYDSDRIDTRNSYQIRSRPYKPAVTDYDYYDDEEERFVGKPHGKLLITSRGIIKCLDQGNFPHPSSCKKFISCAKMVNGNVIGTEYTCPNKLSFDPIGGICNWSAGLGCSE